MADNKTSASASAPAANKQTTSSSAGKQSPLDVLENILQDAKGSAQASKKDEAKKKEAEANAEADKAEREKIDKINSADSLIFQTEKQIKEYGEKLSEGNKTAINEALEELKKAHKEQDLAGIDTAMNNLNQAWQAASQEMYQTTQGGQAGTDGDVQADAGASASDADSDVSDVEFEEVKDDKK